MSKIILLALVAISWGLAPRLSAGEADLKSDLAKLQGKWKGKVAGDDSGHVWTLEIKGNKTTILIHNSGGDEVIKAECDFKLEQHGKFRAYTYSNLKYLSGDKSGETELTGGKTKSSIYRIESESAFTTVSGLRDDTEDDPQWLIRWERVK